MIKETTKNSLTETTLIEHPGGHDGGEFPQDETYTVYDDGSCEYQTEEPRNSCDAFSDEEPGEFINFQTRKGIVRHLKALRKKYNLKVLDFLIKKFNRPGKLTIIYDGHAAYWQDVHNFIYHKDGETWWTGSYWGGHEAPPPPGWVDTNTQTP
jgi:hypothetical protein